MEKIAIKEITMFLVYSSILLFYVKLASVLINKGYIILGVLTIVVGMYLSDICVSLSNKNFLRAKKFVYFVFRKTNHL